MPIYEYICLDCRQPAEILVRNLETEPRCPRCGSNRLEKQVSVPGALLSGHGAKDSPCGHGYEHCQSAGAGCAFPGSCCGMMD